MVGPAVFTQNDATAHVSLGDKSVQHGLCPHHHTTPRPLACGPLKQRVCTYGSVFARLVSVATTLTRTMCSACLVPATRCTVSRPTAVVVIVCRAHMPWMRVTWRCGLATLRYLTPSCCPMPRKPATSLSVSQCLPHTSATPRFGWSPRFVVT